MTLSTFFIICGIVSIVSGVSVIIGKIRITYNHEFWFRLFEDRYGEEGGRLYRIITGINTLVFGLVLLLIGLIDPDPISVWRFYRLVFLLEGVLG